MNICRICRSVLIMRRTYRVQGSSFLQYIFRFVLGTLSALGWQNLEPHLADERQHFDKIKFFNRLRYKISTLKFPESEMLTLKNC